MENNVLRNEQFVARTTALHVRLPTVDAKHRYAKQCKYASMFWLLSDCAEIL